MTQSSFTRRDFLAATGAGALAASWPTRVGAQAGPIRLATLVPMTGAGGPYGPAIHRTAKHIVDEVNAAGGILGRRIELLNEDDQTNPEAGVRAARKLIDVDKVTAIMGTWASAVTSAVAPLCWESRTFLSTVSGADSITQLPHQGYLIRTQPTTVLQGRKFGEFALELGTKRVFYMGPQTPFTQSQFDNIAATVKAKGGEAQMLIYDDKKPSLRTEVDQALRFNPDLIVLGGYQPDTTVLLKDIYRAGYKSKMLGFAYSVNAKLLEGLPAEVSEGIYTIAPSPALGSAAYKRMTSELKVDNPDPYSCQVWDQTSLIVLALAKAQAVSGTAIRDNVRKVSQAADGARADNVIDGLKAVAQGRNVNYDGASGPCDFTDKGDISECQFRYEQVKNGKLALVKVA